MYILNTPIQHLIILSSYLSILFTWYQSLSYISKISIKILPLFITLNPAHLKPAHFKPGSLQTRLTPNPAHLNPVHSKPDSPQIGSLQPGSPPLGSLQLGSPQLGSLQPGSPQPGSRLVFNSSFHF